MLETTAILFKALTLGIAFRFAGRDGPEPGSDVQRLVPARSSEAGPAEVVVLDDHRPKPLPPSAPRKPAVAARRFVVFLQDEEFIGDQRWSGRAGLWQLYLWHCDEDRTTPLPENVFAEALGKLARKRLVRDRSSGKLQRWTVYRIPEPRVQRAAA